MAPTTLPDLPTELLLQIQSYLSYPFHVALYMTCRTLHSALPKSNIRPSATNSNIYLRPSKQTHRQHPAHTLIYDIFDLLIIEAWPCHSVSQPHQEPGRGDFFACSYCLKIRPALDFSNGMMTGQLGKISWLENRNTPLEPKFKMGRYCIPCGIKEGNYWRGLQMQFGGSAGGWGFVCMRCVEFVRELWGYEAPGTRYTCRNCQFTMGRLAEEKWEGRRI